MLSLICAMKICLLTQTNSAFKPISDITHGVISDYAKRHNYGLGICESDSWERSIVWDRFKILADHCDRYDVLVHIDSDVLITNHNIRIEDLIPDREQIVLADCMCENGTKRLNDGIAIFKTSPYMKWLLGECFAAPEVAPIFCGQDVLQARYDSGKLEGKLKVERQKAMNSFLYEEYGMPATTIGNWTKGDFVLHLPGISNARRVEILREKVDHIIQ